VPILSYTIQCLLSFFLSLCYCVVVCLSKILFMLLSTLYSSLYFILSSIDPKVILHIFLRVFESVDHNRFFFKAVKRKRLKRECSKNQLISFRPTPMILAVPEGPRNKRLTRLESKIESNESSKIEIHHDTFYGIYMINSSQHKKQHLICETTSQQRHILYRTYRRIDTAIN
jgi:hypothetical protein